MGTVFRIEGKMNQEKIVAMIRIQPIGLILFFIVSGLVGVSVRFVTPMEQPFFLADPQYWYPHATSSTVPYWLVIGFGIICSLLLVITHLIIYGKNIHALQWAVFGLLVEGITAALTTIFKLVGEFRPDYAVQCFGPDA